MSEIKVNKISPRAACGTVTLGDSGDSFVIPAGATITNNGNQTGFGREGSVNWQTGSIKTASTFTAASGEGYFIDTTGNTITANLPAGSAGAIVAFSDYARNFNNNNFTISPNGSEKIGGIADDLILNVKGQALTLVYVDSTKGWVNVQNAEDTETAAPPFIVATGGTISCTGNDRVHTFTGPGTFSVSSLSPTPANNEISYMVVAGGGGGGDGGTTEAGGGGGAGGFREDKSPVTPYTASPLDGASPITVTVTNFPIVVGAGGSPGCSSPGGGNTPGTNGSVSSFSTITSAGGGGGTSGGAGAAFGGTGGSGGGGNGRCGPTQPGNKNGRSGNTPPVSPPQGNNGGNGAPAPGDYSGGGGGGATAVGGNASAPNNAGPGGAGATTSITGSPVGYAGGGGGGRRCSAPNPAPATQGGGAGGIGNGSTGGNGTTNTGGGGGGNGGPNSNGGNGGSGVVIIRYKVQ
tara:strand:+ start:259 stop:1650 length:1392 start_codon:yes stop_codon:yes gene_type:complete